MRNWNYCQLLRVISRWR